MVELCVTHTTTSFVFLELKNSKNSLECARLDKVNLNLYQLKNHFILTKSVVFKVRVGYKIVSKK